MIKYTIRITNPLPGEIGQEFEIEYGPADPPEREFQSLFAYLSPAGQKVIRTHHKRWQKRDQQPEKKG
jgi:hypothetical protein